MSLENQLRESLHEEANEIVPSPELKLKVISRINTKPKREVIKKRLVVSFLIALLLIPTSVLAYQTLLADEIYGSFDNLKKHISSATMEGYLLFNAKLSVSKGELEEEEYKNFKELLSDVTTAKLEYGDKHGNIDYDQLLEEKVIEIKNALMAIQPYFDRLNGQKSSMDVLTAEEYDKYIEALMTYEKVVAQSGIDTSKPIDVEKLPEELRSIFLEARDYMRYVDEKQLQ